MITEFRQILYFVLAVLMPTSDLVAVALVLTVSAAIVVDVIAAVAAVVIEAGVEVDVVELYVAVVLVLGANVETELFSGAVVDVSVDEVVVKSIVVMLLARNHLYTGPFDV